MAAQAQTNQGNAFAKRNKEFGELEGYSFAGEGTPAEADQWIVHSEWNFEKMKLTNVQKVELAAHRLEGPALFKWESELKCLGRAMTT